MPESGLSTPTDTKMLFGALIKALDLDCVCDIGSRDGNQAILFRDILPDAKVIAFEANPLNFRTMQTRQALSDKRIEISPHAISNANATATFYISDVDYDDPAANKGTSSLLANGYPTKQVVEVETKRLDDWLSANHPSSSRIGLWIDVESAEYMALEGIQGIVDKVKVLHVETSILPVRESKTFEDLKGLLESYGFVLCGSGDFHKYNISDVVFIQQRLIPQLGVKYRLALAKGLISKCLPIHDIAAFLRDRFPSIYRPLRAAYLKLVA